jgi:hypothetical protein
MCSSRMDPPSASATAPYGTSAPDAPTYSSTSHFTSICIHVLGTGREGAEGRVVGRGREEGKGEQWVSPYMLSEHL